MPNVYLCVTRTSIVDDYETRSIFTEPTLLLSELILVRHFRKINALDFAACSDNIDKRKPETIFPAKIFSYNFQTKLSNENFPSYC